MDGTGTVARGPVWLRFASPARAVASLICGALYFLNASWKNFAASALDSLSASAL